MAIQPQGTPSVYEAASSTSAVVPYPSGIVSGEILIFHATSSDATISTTPPTGFTLGKAQNGPSSSPSTVVFYRVADATESGSATFNTGGANGRLTSTMTRWSGVDTTTPIDVAGVSANVGVSLTFDMPTITTATDGAMLLHVISLNASNPATNDINTLAGTTKHTGATGTGRLSYVFYEERTTAGATGTRQWSKTGATTLQWSGCTIALRPAAGAPSVKLGSTSTSFHPGRGPGHGRFMFRATGSTYQPPNSPNSFTADPADPAGITDAAARTQAGVRAQADAASVTDAATDTLTAARTTADPAGITDAVTGIKGPTRTVPDGEGITDAVTAVKTKSHTIADPAGITDARTVVRTSTRTQADAEGIADAAARTQAMARTRADTTGITDTATPILSGTTPVLNRCVNDVPGTTTMAIKVNTTDATSVRIKAGTNSGLTTGVVWGSPVTPDGQDNSEPTITGLTADTPYFYRIAMTNGAESLDVWSTVGEFKTDATGAQTFSVGFGSCVNASDSASMGAIAVKKPDLFLHLGDEYYADGSGTSVANFRTKMDAKRTATNHKAVYRTSGSSITPSDHDGMNNNSNAATDATAWTNYNSVYREMNPTTDLPGTGVYRSMKRGRVRILRIDRRSLADNPADTDNSSKDSLGTTQKQWLKDQITNATEPVILIQNPDPWIGSASAGDDGWFGYTTERTELANHILASKKNVIILGGDMHAVAADDGTNAPGKVTVFHGAPLNNNASIKGGPYTQGPYPASGTAVVDQYGWIDFTDTGGAITATFKGFSSDNTQRVTLTARFATPADTEGITDARALGRTTAKTDAAGVTDARATVQAMARARADTAGITDAVTVVKTTARTAADTAGVTDAAVDVLAAARTVADTTGITDSATGVKGPVRTIPDALGVTDARTVTRTTGRTLADALGLTDTAAPASGRARPAADPLGVTDQVAGAVAGSRARADAEGITDTRTLDRSTARADALGVTDAATAARTSTRTRADTAGITDAVTATRTTARTVSDNLGVTDTAEQDGGSKSRTVPDAVGLLDATAVQRTSTRTQADQQGITDARTAARGFNRTQADGTGLTDAVNTALSTARTAADTAGITDQVAGVKGPNRTITDALGVTDARTVQRTTARALADPLAAADNAQDAVAGQRTSPDTAGLTDQAAAELGRARTSADPAGITDTAVDALDAARARADALGVTDQTTKILGQARDHADSAGITDQVTTVRTTAKALADSLGITDIGEQADGSKNRTIPDAAGITDQVTATATTDRAQADTAGIADTATDALAADRAIPDAAGITDAVMVRIDRAATITDPIGTTDTPDRAAAYTRARADAAAITDALQALKGHDYVKAVTDTIGILDAAAADILDRHYIVTIDIGAARWTADADEARWDSAPLTTGPRWTADTE